MFDGVGSLRLRKKSAHRVELTLTRQTSIVGWLLALGGGFLAIAAWTTAWVLAVVPGIVAIVGLLLATVRRDLVFDREDGLLRIEQRILGITSRASIPLFHLRSVVVSARVPRFGATPRYVAYVERRIGGAIHLDESRRCAALLRLAEAIADAAELRLVYDATANATTHVMD
jgi:hypothetical protein